VNWYESLHKPPLTPPNWIFSPVWTVLYISIAVSIFLYFRSRPKPHLWLTGIVLVAHMFSNFIWTWLFFGLHSPPLALADIVFMDISLVVLIALFWKANRVAAGILVPYLLWILFATYLNLMFCVLN
jgi:tryptophan-rich sensory protein